MESRGMHDAREEKYSKTQKRPPDYGNLIGLVKPLLHIMMAAIILGTMGYLCAIFLTILAGQVIVHGLLTGAAGTSLSVQNMWLVHTPVKRYSR